MQENLESVSCIEMETLQPVSNDEVFHADDVCTSGDGDGDDDGNEQGEAGDCLLHASHLDKHALASQAGGSKQQTAARRQLDALMSSLPVGDQALLAEHAASYRGQDISDGASHSCDAPGTSLTRTCYIRVRALALLMILQSCSGFILERHEKFIEEHVYVTLYLTMLVGAGGNAGAQSAVSVIRGLATGDLARSRAAAVLWHECKLGLLEGAALTCVGFGRVYLFQYELRSSIAVCLSLFAITSISVFVGALLPLALDRVGMDPAHAGPTIQVVMDILGVFLTCTICSTIAGDVGTAQQHNSTSTSA